MNSKVVLVIRIFFGLFLIIFGSNKFFNFMPPPPPEQMPEALVGFMMAFMSTKMMYLVGAVETIAGITLLINKYAPLLMVILMSVSINAVLTHLTLAPESIVPALVLLALNIFMLYVYRARYTEMLKP